MKTLLGALCLALLLLPRLAEAAASAERPMVSSEEYQQRPVLESSLFQSDKELLAEEAIQRILSSKFALPESISVALYRIQESPQKAIRYYGYGYWRSEEYLKVQQSFISAIAGEIAASDRVLEVVSLPTLLTAKAPTIPLIRETCVRLQADMALVFTLTSDVYEKYRFFQSDQAKAFCTCEGFLLDVRTGLIPFSRIVTREFLSTKEKTDANFNETMARAEKEAAIDALKSLGKEVVDVLSSIPRPQ